MRLTDLTFNPFDVIQWILDLLLVVVLGVLGWFHKQLSFLTQQKAEMSLKIALLEEQPKVDPLKYMEAITTVMQELKAMREKAEILAEQRAAYQIEIRGRLSKIEEALNITPSWRAR